MRHHSIRKIKWQYFVLISLPSFKILKKKNVAHTGAASLKQPETSVEAFTCWRRVVSHCRQRSVHVDILIRKVTRRKKKKRTAETHSAPFPFPVLFSSPTHKAPKEKKKKSSAACCFTVIPPLRS